MTIYFQGTELEAMWPNPAFTTSGESTSTAARDSAWSRAGLGPGSTNSWVEGDAKEMLTLAWFRWYWSHGSATAASGISPMVILTDDDLEQIARIRIVSAGIGQFEYFDGSSWQALGDTFGLTTNGLRVYHDLKVDFAAGNHKLELYRDEVLIASKIGGEFLQYGGSQRIRFQGGGNPLANSQVMIADEETINRHVLTVSPNADGTDTDGVGAVSTINEVATNNATYIAFSASAQKRSFKAPARSLSTTIKGVTVAGRWRRADEDAPTQVRPYLLIEGVRYYGTTFTLTLGFLNYQYTWQVNPATTAEWTPSEVNNADLEFGWEVV